MDGQLEFDFDDLLISEGHKTTNIRESEIIFGLNTKLKILDSRVENVTSWPQRVILECEIVE